MSEDLRSGLWLVFIFSSLYLIAVIRTKMHHNKQKKLEREKEKDKHIVAKVDNIVFSFNLSYTELIVFIGSTSNVLNKFNVIDIDKFTYKVDTTTGKSYVSVVLDMSIGRHIKDITITEDFTEEEKMKLVEKLNNSSIKEYTKILKKRVEDYKNGSLLQENKCD